MQIPKFHKNHKSNLAFVQFEKPPATVLEIVFLKG